VYVGARGDGVQRAVAARPLDQTSVSGPEDVDDVVH